MIRRTKCAHLIGNQSLSFRDPELYHIIKSELKRQVTGLELIASENFTSRSVLECLGSVCTNKYAEGYPGKRYYGGNQYIDQVETLCQQRALRAFNLCDKVWGVNVQAYSGSPANFAAYTALLSPHDRLMGLSLPHGGHLTHGFYTPTRKISATSIYFESLPYHTVPETGHVDYVGLETSAKNFLPKLIIAGGSAYTKDWNYQKFREIADAVGARLLVDMSHVSGLVAAGEHNDPFLLADVVTSTTHKSLRGPRSALIFYNKQRWPKGEESINNAIFPGLQGGPHVHQIAAVATQLLEVMQPDFKAYIQHVKKNAKHLGAELISRGYKLVGGGTENHLLLLDLRTFGLSGSRAEKVLEQVHITTNKNSVVGDKSAMNPGGLRLGTPALTTRGFTVDDFTTVSRFLHEALSEGLNIQSRFSPKTLLEFSTLCAQSEVLQGIGKEVECFSAAKPFPGFDSEYPIA